MGNGEWGMGKVQQPDNNEKLKMKNAFSGDNCTKGIFHFKFYIMQGLPIPDS